MKAMEELQDDRIYADEQPKQNPAFQSSAVATKDSKIETSNNSDLPLNIQNLLNSTKDNKVAV